MGVAANIEFLQRPRRPDADVAGRINIQRTGRSSGTNADNASAGCRIACRVVESQNNNADQKADG